MLSLFLIFGMGPGGVSAATPTETSVKALAFHESGYRDPQTEADHRASFERLRTGIAERLSTVELLDRPRRLLSILHADGPLRHYDARATTLEEIFSEGRYNCVSASILYNLVAEGLDIPVGAELLPTHARSLVRFPAGDVVVETTSPHGYDPSPQQLKKILETVSAPVMLGERTMVSTAGERVQTHELIAVMLVNRASIAQEAGKIEKAEGLFRRSAELVASAEIRQILRDQRAALLSQLAADDLAAPEEARNLRALTTLGQALALRPKHKPVRRTVVHNYRVAAARVARRFSSAKRDEALLRLEAQVKAARLPASDRDGVFASVRGERARAALLAKEPRRALRILEPCLQLDLLEQDRSLRTALFTNYASAARMVAFELARRGETEAALRELDARLSRIPGQRETQPNDRRRIIHWAAQAHLDQEHPDLAIATYERGMAIGVRDQSLINNLLALLERRALGELELGCSRAKATLSRIEALAPKSAFSRKAKLRCLVKEAERALANGAYPSAAEQLAAALALDPGSSEVRHNLGLTYVRWVQAETRAGRCRDAARVQARGLKLGLPPQQVRALRAAFAACPS